MSRVHRRDFLKHSVHIGAALGAADLAFLRGLPPLAAQDVQVPRQMVRLHTDIEPLVRLIEDTPRDRLLERIAERIREGTGYQPILAALMLAGVRGIQPRPVGFKFHAVLVVNSAHLAAQNAQDRDRWLPLFWALDNFKSSQERNRREGDWRMPPLEDNQLPATRTAAINAFRDAMESWNEEATDRAVAALARTCGIDAVYELFWRYGARDFRDIGHKAIFAANSYRTLQTIGWRHGEPIVRSLAYAMLQHEGGNPAQRDADQDRPWRENLRRADAIRADWQTGQPSSDATTAVLGVLRTGTPAQACDEIVSRLNARVSPTSLWDACFLGAGELLMRQPGIVGLHTLTTTNALHFAYETSGNDSTRRMLLLQTAAFLPMFRGAMVGRGQVANGRLDTLDFAPAADVDARTPVAVQHIFDSIGNDRTAAARQTLALLAREPQAADLVMQEARRYIFTKGNDSHDYKFSSAVLEDFYHVAPAWRNRFLASSMFWLRGSAGPDSPVLRRTQQALARG
jgi:hypothetical protein